MTEGGNAVYIEAMDDETMCTRAVGMTRTVTGVPNRPSVLQVRESTSTRYNYDMTHECFHNAFNT